MNRNGGRMATSARWRGSCRKAARKARAESLPGTAWYLVKEGGRDPSHGDGVMAREKGAIIELKRQLGVSRIQ